MFLTLLVHIPGDIRLDLLYHIIEETEFLLLHSLYLKCPPLTCFQMFEYITTHHRWRKVILTNDASLALYCQDSTQSLSRRCCRRLVVVHD